MTVRNAKVQQFAKPLFVLAESLVGVFLDDAKLQISLAVKLAIPTLFHVSDRSEEPFRQGLHFVSPHERVGASNDNRNVTGEGC